MMVQPVRARIRSPFTLLLMAWLALLSARGEARWLVREDDAATQKKIEQAGLTVVHRYRHFPWLVCEGTGEAETRFARARAALGLKGEPVHMFYLARVPDDPSFSLQTDIAFPNADANIFLREAWDIQTSALSTVVATIDTGIDVIHPDLVDNFWTNQAEANGTAGVDDDGNGYVDDIHGWNTVDRSNDLRDFDSHGTGVAGIIAARGNNGVGIAGTCWDARVMVLKAFSGNQGGDDQIMAAIDYILSFPEVRVINASWGDTVASEAMHDALAVAGRRGVLVVAAAGNNNANLDTSPFYPAADAKTEDYIVAVASTSQTGAKASFSNYGPAVTVLAPGVLLYTTNFNQSYRNASGTSFSTPRVVGAAALLMAAHPDLSPATVKALLNSTSRQTTPLQTYPFGGGLLNVQALLHSSPNAARGWTMYP